MTTKSYQENRKENSIKNVTIFSLLTVVEVIIVSLRIARQVHCT